MEELKKNHVQFVEKIKKKKIKNQKFLYAFFSSALPLALKHKMYSFTSEKLAFIKNSKLTIKQLFGLKLKNVKQL